MCKHAKKLGGINLKTSKTGDVADPNLTSFIYFLQFLRIEKSNPYINSHDHKPKNSIRTVHVHVHRTLLRWSFASAFVDCSSRLKQW